MAGRKTTIDVNDELLESARRVLGTKGTKETIDRALYEVVVQDARMRTVERLAKLDIDAAELRRDAWEG
jgi:Arc/MetJ family transcription regulator